MKIDCCEKKETPRSTFDSLSVGTVFKGKLSQSSGKTISGIFVKIAYVGEYASSFYALHLSTSEAFQFSFITYIEEVFPDATLKCRP